LREPLSIENFKMTHNEIGGGNCRYGVGDSSAAGAGLLESVYAAVMAHELRKRGCG